MRRENQEPLSDLIAPALERVSSEIDYALLAAQGEEESQDGSAIVNVYQNQGSSKQVPTQRQSLDCVRSR